MKLEEACADERVKKLLLKLSDMTTPEMYRSKATRIPTRQTMFTKGSGRACQAAGSNVLAVRAAGDNDAATLYGETWFMGQLLLIRMFLAAACMC